MPAIPATHPGKAVFQDTAIQVAVDNLLNVGTQEAVLPWELTARHKPARRFQNDLPRIDNMAILVVGAGGIRFLTCGTVSFTSEG